MIFKLFTLFNVFALIKGTSVGGESSPSYITRRSHHQHQHNDNGLAHLFTRKTITVTKTITETQTCEPTDDFTDTPTELPTDSSDLNSQEHCLYIFNEFRKSVNLPPFESATQEQIDCADKAAEYDAKAGYHASFRSGLCSPQSQCECLPSVGIGIKDSVSGDPLQNCINAYIAEYTQGLWPELNLGHYRIITGNFKYVACGTDGNGFYTHNFYN